MDELPGWVHRVNGKVLVVALDEVRHGGCLPSSQVSRHSRIRNRENRLLCLIVLRPDTAFG